VIALFVFSLIYVLAATVFCLAATLSRRSVARDLMASGQATLQSIAVGLAEAMTEILSIVPAQANQRLAQERALEAIEQALNARRNRILLSQAEISPIRWTLIVVLAMLILVTIALLHIDKRVAMAISMFIFSTAVAACLVLLMVYDRPFGAGGFAVTPAVLRAVMPNG
jgi:hypothetical protein